MSAPAPLIDLDTPLRGPVDVAPTPDARFMGGAYDDATVAAFWAALRQVSAAFGMRASILAGQIAHETAWFRFGGQVAATQYNLAGLGATNDGAAGVSYPDIATGVRAVATHWLVYRYGDVARWPEGLRQYQGLDQRYAAVLSTGRGGTVRLLRDVVNGVWAYTRRLPVGTLDNGYAAAIAAKATMLQGAGGRGPGTGDGGQGTGGNVTPPTIVDVRGQLPTAPGQGSGQTMARPVGLVLHYSATPYADNADIMQIMRSEAAYHIGPYLREAGLAYHYVVDWRTGAIYQARDENAVLWHVGSWAPGGNGTGLSIHVPGDGAMRLSAAGLAGLTALWDWLRARSGIPRDMVRPHRFFGTSACPGDYLAGIVADYVAGRIGGGDMATTYKDPVTGKTLANAMYEFWTRTGGLDVHGRPLTEEYTGTWPDDGKTRTMQVCERTVLAFFPELSDPYRVQSLRLGAAWAKAQGITGPGI